jgi:hypothetical protein
LLCALCGYLLLTNFARNDQSNNDEADARWREILTQPLEENALLVGPWEDLTPLEYFQNVEHLSADLHRKKVIVYQDQLKIVPQGDLAPALREELSRGVYLTRHPADTETLGSLEQFTLIPYATLWRMAEPKTQAVTRAYGADQELQSVAASNTKPQAGNFFTLALNWSNAAPLAQMRLVWTLRDASKKIWRMWETLPFGGQPLPQIETARRDPQGFFIPPDAPPGEYTLDLAAFERDSQNALPLVGDSNTLALALNVQASKKATAPARVEIPHPFPTQVGDAKFLGYDVSDAEPRGGDVLEFSAWWQNIARGDEPFEIKLRDASDAETILYQGALFPNSSGEFNPQQIVRARHELTIPPTAAAGYAQVLLRLNGQTLPPLRLALRETTRKFREPIIAHPQIVLVGDALQLLGYKLDRAQYRAGETLPLTLYWNANATPNASYKVFVHLVDVNGVLRAQRDSIPQNNALPTNRWFPGEYVTDEYAVNLPSDLAAGEYRLFVGMYDKASGARVPLFDAHAARIADDAVMLDDKIQIR